jgi:hypothetical protein
MSKSRNVEGDGSLHTFLCSFQSSFWQSLEQYQVFLHREHHADPFSLGLRV